MSLYTCRDGCKGQFFLNWSDFVEHLESVHRLDWEPEDIDQYGTT